MKYCNIVKQRYLENIEKFSFSVVTCKVLCKTVVKKFKRDFNSPFLSPRTSLKSNCTSTHLAENRFNCGRVKIRNTYLRHSYYIFLICVYLVTIDYYHFWKWPLGKAISKNFPAPQENVKYFSDITLATRDWFSNCLLIWKVIAWTP